jgi:hypothetical protein
MIGGGGGAAAIKSAEFIRVRQAACIAGHTSHAFKNYKVEFFAKRSNAATAESE